MPPRHCNVGDDDDDEAEDDGGFVAVCLLTTYLFIMRFFFTFLYMFFFLGRSNCLLFWNKETGFFGRHTNEACMVLLGSEKGSGDCPRRL